MSNRIFDLRKQLKMTQQELADALEINRSTINHWELSHRPIPSDELVRLADYFNVSIDYLLNRETKTKLDTPNEPALTECPPELISDGMNGKPVFSKEKGWLLINYPSGICYDMRGRTYKIEDIGRVYINSPESYPYHLRFDKPIDVDELKKMKGQTVWVEPLTDDANINGMIRGWYTVGEGIVMNDIAFRLYFAT